ncbi:MAG: C-type lectin domain-containing protein [Armatimonadota bacterium]|nr:C-type lectin domain-containing protein [Armatimonadota bacterium]
MRRRTTMAACSTLIIIALACTIAAAQDVQWTTWETDQGGNGHQYAVLLEAKGWDAQEADAEALGAHLATITSAEESTFVYDLYRAAKGDSATPTDYFWIGLRQDPDAKSKDEGWGWITGEGLDYTEWHNNEPNDWEGVEDVGAVYAKFGGWWIDANAAVANLAVIEKGDGWKPDPDPDRGSEPDETPPDVTLESPQPPVLPWRSPFRLKPVSISGSVVDDVSGVQSAVVVVTDEYGRHDGKYDVTELLDKDGKFRLTVYLRSWVRPRDFDGRDYEFQLQAADNEGNEAVSDTKIVKAQRPGWRKR